MDKRTGSRSPALIAAATLLTLVATTRQVQVQDPATPAPAGRQGPGAGGRGGFGGFGPPTTPTRYDDYTVLEARTNRDNSVTRARS